MPFCQRELLMLRYTYCHWLLYILPIFYIFLALYFYYFQNIFFLASYFPFAGLFFSWFLPYHITTRVAVMASLRFISYAGRQPRRLDVLRLTAAYASAYADDFLGISGLLVFIIRESLPIVSFSGCFFADAARFRLLSDFAVFCW